MARGDQLARQWKIVQTLTTCRLGKSAADLARELDIHPRTVYRDLIALQEAGFPIYTERINGKSLWSFLDTVKHQIPIPFTMPELLALYFGRDTLKSLQGTIFYDAIESLYGKITSTLPPESKTFIDKATSALKAGKRPHKPYAAFNEIIHQINQAIVDRRTIDMVYYTLSRRKMTKRTVAPYRIWYNDGSFYLIGHCSMQKDIRIFALDRIKMLHVTDDGFDMPADFDVDRFMQDSFGVFVGKPVHVKVWFAPQAAGYIKEKIWHPSQRIESQKDGSIIFEAEVAGVDEIKFWLLSWGARAVVLEPKSLRVDILSEAAAMQARYTQSETTMSA